MFQTLTAAEVEQSFLSTLPEPVRVDLRDVKDQIICAVYLDHLCLGLGVGPTVKHAEKAAALNCFKQFSNDLNVACFMNRLRADDIARLNFQ